MIYVYIISEGVYKMSLSYSFHISSKKHSLSNINKLQQVSKHNLRAYKSDDYNKEKIEVLIGSDNLIEDVKQVYQNEFSEALKEYNDKKRDDRKINDYLKHVSDSNSDVAVEIIVQIGNMEYWSNKSLKNKKEMIEVYKEQIQSLKNYLPNFKIASAVVHLDESSPHMHIVGVPVSSDYKKGLKVQCSKTKVFTKDSLENLQEFMHNEVIKSIDLHKDIFENQTIKKKEKGRNIDIPKKSLNEYYELQTENHYLQEQNEQLIEIIQENINTIDLANNLIQKVDKLDKYINTLKIVPKTLLNSEEHYKIIPSAMRLLKEILNNIKQLKRVLYPRHKKSVHQQLVEARSMLEDIKSRKNRSSYKNKTKNHDLER